MLRKPMPGTNVRRAFDTRRLSEALKSQDIDLRHWVSYGTVGTLDDEGNFNPNDSRAIYNGPEGVEVDVLLEPLGQPATCRYAGIAGGRLVSIMAPIKPGDLVIVTLASGGLLEPPVIVAVLNSMSQKVQLGTDKKPVFKNNHVLVKSTVPVEIDAPNIKVGSVASTEPLVLGNELKDWLNDLIDAISALTVTCAGPGNPSSPPVNIGTFTTLGGKIDALLSGKAFTE